jgi:NDP-sugar pyrophosphorylase family protein
MAEGAARIRHALIMAAGRGQRMGALTDVVPKPMAPIHGTTLISHGIKALVGHVPQIHITVGYKKAMLAQHVIENGASSVFNTEGQSNAWWIHNTLMSHLDEPIFLMTCDNVMELDFEMLEKSYHELQRPPCMLVPVKPVAGLEGDYIFHRKQVVTELDRHKPADIYCSGLQVINPRAVASITRAGGDFYAIWKQLIEQGKLMVSETYPKKWISIDTFEQLSEYNRGTG